jgi:hypothetical protein
VRTPLFEYSGLGVALLRSGRRERVPSSGPFRSRRLGRTRAARYQVLRPPGSSKWDARVRPIGEGKATRIHPYPGFDQSSHGQELSRAGRRATGTI